MIVEASTPTDDLAVYLWIHFSCLLEFLHSVVFKVKPTLISLIGAASEAFDSRAASLVIPCLHDVLSSKE
jgi:hypothetical protein